ncbi:UDP-3-O-(3-hydroxymyristoyl)glucosamine N-acyltransferase [bacterium]|nr:UDP-3-O-(3-hydroxymyristoyl)glucosamine N-acyltransferase [bacterium]
MSIYLSDLAKHLHSTLLGDDRIIKGVAEPFTKNDDQVILILEKKTINKKDRIRSKAWIVARLLFNDQLKHFLTSERISYMVVDQAYEALRQTIEFFYPNEFTEQAIHHTAIVHPEAKIGEKVFIGAFCEIEKKTSIDDSAVIAKGCFIGQNSKIGRGVHLDPNVTVYPNTEIGNNVIIHSGTVIGSDGFGFYSKEGVHIKIPHIGKVIIEDDVEIGANCCIARGTLGETRIKKGTKIDNLVQIAHNVVIGEHTLIAAQAGIAGSTTIGDHVIIAGQAGIVGHIEIGNRVTIGAQAGVIGSIEEGQTVSGYPAREHSEAMKREAHISQIPKILESIKAKKKRAE